ncbi:MAG: hypothetical protein PWQ28_166 [Candidatus Woesearchaeota archaeon]|nr:hypothetical protein [Candidatus Woesearchaeota archaeon]
MEKITKEDVLNALSNVYDPEIPVNIVDLGLIYDVNIDDNNIKILMTMTSPACPLGNYVASMAEHQLKEEFPEANVDIELTFSPQWTPDMINSNARERLNL